MNENKKIRFNVVDVIIILLIVACVVGIIFRANVREKLGQSLSNETAYITLVAENVPQEYIDAFVQGSSAYLEDMDLGIIIGYSYTEQTNVILDLNEKYEYKAVDDGNGGYINTVEKIISPEFKTVYDKNSYTVTCQIQVSGQDKSDGFYIGGVEYIGVGKMLNISTENHAFTMTITKISDKAS